MTIKKDRIAVIGDLHYELKNHDLFQNAKNQILSFAPDLLISLGDLGGYTHCGSLLSFNEGYQYFSEFKIPFFTLIGNHDMEGKEYLTDEESVNAWLSVFKKESPYYSHEHGGSKYIFLSSTGYRSNPGSSHEIYIDPFQIQWFREELKKSPHMPTYVFSHCPMLGSGIKVLQSLHLKIPNAWLNHSYKPEIFFEIVEQNPQIKAWFSGHNHLGHNYSDSINQVGNCTFVHTGVISVQSRDGFHHSRILDVSDKGFEIYTLNHDNGDLVCDYQLDFENHIGIKMNPAPEPPPSASPHFGAPAFPLAPDSPLLVHHKSAFIVHKNTLLEYNHKLKAPLGIVREEWNDKKLHVSDNSLVLTDSAGHIETIEPDEEGWYRQIYLPNPTQILDTDSLFFTKPKN